MTFLNYPRREIGGGGRVTSSNPAPEIHVAIGVAKWPSRVASSPPNYRSPTPPSHWSTCPLFSNLPPPPPEDPRISPPLPLPPLAGLVGPITAPYLAGPIPVRRSLRPPSYKSAPLRPRRRRPRHGVVYAVVSPFHLAALRWWR